MNSNCLRLLFLPCFLVALAAAASGQDVASSTIRQKVEASLPAMNAVAHFDQAYASTANPKQMLDLYLPNMPVSDRPLPVIVYIHGGAWQHGDRATSTSVLRFVKTGKYAGVSISYRLSDEAKWPAQILDCKAAIRWIRAHAKEFHLDPDHIGVWGSSAGGHLVSLLGTSGGVQALDGDLGDFDDLSSRVTCVVNQCGPQDFQLPLMYANGEPLVEDPAVVGLIGGSVKDNGAKIVESSPVTYVSSDDAPFLHLHGTKDQRVSFQHAERIHAALKTAGVTSLLIPVVDGGHGLSHPGLLPLVEKFFGRYLRGEEVEIVAGPLVPGS